MSSQLVSKLVWIAKRPQYYPEFVNKIRNRIASWGEEANISKVKARLNVISLEENEFLQKFGIHSDKSFFELYKDEVDSGNEHIARCGETLGGPTALNAMFHIVRKNRFRSVIETGVAYGWSTLAFLAATEQTPDSRVVSTDFPQLASSGENVGLVVPKRLRSRWTLFRGADRTELPRALTELGTIDFCHYDSDKSYSGRMFAYPLLWNALKPGGFFVSDDIGDNTAFLDFCEATEVAPQILRIPREKMTPKYVGCVVKPKAA